MDKLTTVVARYMYALPFGIFGLFHFMEAQGMAGMVPSWLPGGVFWVYLTGVALVAAAVSIIIGKHAALATLLLAAMLGVFVLTVHLPMVLNQETMMMGMVALLKDIALAGGALTLSGIFRQG